MAAIGIMMIGFGAGVEYDFMAYLVSKYFGMRGYSSIYGAIYSFFAIGGSTAPAVMLRTAEADGNWQNMMTYSAIAMIVGSLPLLLLGKYREFPNKE
jgi:MFS family permease